MAGIQGSGQSRKKGEVLALIDAADLGKAKANLLQTIVQFNLRKANYQHSRAGGIPWPGASSWKPKRAGTAQVEMLEAQQAAWRISAFPWTWTRFPRFPKEISLSAASVCRPATLLGGDSRSGYDDNLLPITVPFDGIILEQDVVSGEVVDLQKTLF